LETSSDAGLVDSDTEEVTEEVSNSQPITPIARMDTRPSKKPFTVSLRPDCILFSGKSINRLVAVLADGSRQPTQVIAQFSTWPDALYETWHPNDQSLSLLPTLK
jgi:hypothetical protein